MKQKMDVRRRAGVVFIAITVIVLLLLLALACALFVMRSRMSKTVVEATCTQSGHVIVRDLWTETKTVENLPALGHDFGDWVTDEAAGTQRRTCSRCSLEESVRLSSIPDESIPALYLTGSMEGISKKTKVALEAEFVGMDQRFECYAIMTLQGHSTFGYPKRNYTVRFYDDAQSEEKHKLQFKNWNPEHKYILKANYIDASQCRNIVGARIWSSMAADRAALHPRIAALPTYGAVDGFPVSVYLNGEFHGLYTLNLHKDDDLYGMEEGEQAALVICNQQTTDEALFRANAAFAEDYSSDWEIEFCGTQDEAWAKERFNALIDFVMTSSDEAFCNGLPQHLDVEAAIDYLIFIYALGLQHSGAKDLVMLSYGDVWIPSAYDMDEAFGLDAQAAAYLAPDAFVPVKEDGAWRSGTGSLLWDRMLNLYEDEIRARYASLRGGVLKEETLIGMVDAFVGGIPEMQYDLDMNLYAGRPVSDADMHAQITGYITQRLAVLDSILEESDL